ncbi:MAG: ThuA domain-containing protein [Verrucomicrobiae bacterium]|nr:ThuA domain-containing protein [Verrucomicrobiae bacterium]
MSATLFKRLRFPVSLVLLFLAASGVKGETFHLKLRSESEVSPGTKRFHSLTRREDWDASRTAVVICDMWDDHYCRSSAKRVAEMAPRMNEVVKKARAAGALIIHCPSGCMNFYADTPQRKLAQEAPRLGTTVPLEGWCYQDPEREPEMPVKIDQPCDDEDALRPRVRFYNRQIETIEIAPEDAITESAEAFFLMKSRGIENVLVMGVHTNMCVLGRPFGIRQLVRQGMKPVLVRDMTDSMYNPAEPPFVNHFTGNDLIFEHIEKYWCPTTTSGDILGDDKVFRFATDIRPHLVIVTAEDEYRTEETLPAFAIRELGRTFKISVVYGDEEEKWNLPGVAVVRDADLLLLSVRRRNLPPEQLALFRDHIAAGKPLVGIRTASHAFHQRNEGAGAGLDEWRDFDAVVLGGNYTGHHGNEIKTFAKVVPDARPHPILAGVDPDEFATAGSLYQNTPLQKNTEVLMMGRAEGIEQPEPVAWVSAGPGGGRVFYTSLGHPGDFEVPAFRTMLRNAVYWAAGDLPVLVTPKP